MADDTHFWNAANQLTRNCTSNHFRVHALKSEMSITSMEFHNVRPLRVYISSHTILRKHERISNYP